MSLFSKSAAIELKEFKTKFAALETEFNSYKESNKAFEAEKETLTSKLASYETEISGLKDKETNLAAELSAKSSELETLKSDAKSVSEAAALELAKIGQPPIAQALVVASADKDKIYEDFMAITDPAEKRAFYLKNIKGK